MMHTWFEGKIRYEKVAENGMNKKVTGPYLVDALSFTEAEARLIEEVTLFISGEFTVTDIKRANYSEIFPSDEKGAGTWYKCKLYFITLDEKSGAEKKTTTNILVQAADLRDAVKKLDEGMKGTLADYVIASVAETAIMDVYPYQAEAEAQPEFEEYDYEKLSAAARVCHNLGITEKDGRKCIGMNPINVLNIHYGYGSGLKLIQQLINKGVLKREEDYISVVDKPLEEFDWYIKPKEDNGKVE
jgi:hypothetical protein